MDTDHDNVDEQEEIQKRRILAQKKEKKIKMIRMLTVVAYLVSVSTVAASLSAYYVFIWNPYAGNTTQTPNTEGMVMALHRVGGEYVFADTVAANRRYLDNGKFVSDVLITNNKYKIDNHHVDIGESAEIETANMESSSLRTHMKVGKDPSSASFTETNSNNS
ncbi:TRP-interacting helix, InaF motif [Cinara cedri]|uniref:TRP-interacting helix, InaF motif n=1 Tax=Cinara cedri TaxID=506608 RepID=A0A5E4N4D6_9HEMI|nr:TRP-interacting helix, InaF motif [Cinara cedri]